MPKVLSKKPAGDEAAATTALTAFVVQVREAETLVRELHEITPEVLARAAAALAGFAAFDFRLSTVARFPGTVYLRPQPAAPFIALTEALVRAFPGLAPYGGAHAAIVPRLTVGRGDESTADRLVTELQAAATRQPSS